MTSVLAGNPGCDKKPYYRLFEASLSSVPEYLGYERSRVCTLLRQFDLSSGDTIPEIAQLWRSVTIHDAQRLFSEYGCQMVEGEDFVWRLDSRKFLSTTVPQDFARWRYFERAHKSDTTDGPRAISEGVGCLNSLMMLYVMWSAIESNRSDDVRVVFATGRKPACLFTPRGILVYKWDW